MPQEYTFSSVSPVSGPKGTLISLNLADGIPDIYPGSLTPLGGYFTREDASIPTNQAVIWDSQTYKRFSILVPFGCAPGKEYDISVFLESKTDSGDQFLLTADTKFLVTGSGAAQATVIDKIIPQIISYESLRTQILTIEGAFLDNLNQNKNITLIPGNYAFRIISKTESEARIKAMEGGIVEPGRYYVQGFLSDGSRCKSQAGLTVI